MRLVATSDTHNYHKELVVPDGDVFIHAGDITENGSLEELQDFAQWLKKLPHKWKLLTGGNHDHMFQSDLHLAKRILGTDRKTKLLLDSGVTIAGKVFWGSPRTPWFGDMAFVYRHTQAEAVWNRLPDKIDVLITHGPAFGRNDMVRMENVGCPALANAISRRKIPLHICGHIHQGHGFTENPAHRSYNVAACCSKLMNPVVIDL
jgi:Icc-related predicted phosphoesterase